MKCFRVSKICNNFRKLQALQVANKSSAKALSFAEVESDFENAFPDIVRDLTSYSSNSKCSQMTEWVAKILQCTVPNGNKKKGMLVPLTYKTLEDPGRITPENIKISNILGWCFEMNIAFLIILDDIFDCSDTRRGTPCWYKRENVGMGALNDSVILENGTYLILQRYLSKLPSYVSCVELFHESTWMFAMAEALENLSSIEGKSNIDEFSMNRYNAITSLKSEPYNFLFPMTIAMHFAGKFDAKTYAQVSPILKRLGRLVQVNNDFRDCFSTDKIGTDIQKGRCTWLIATAVERATSAQKAILRANYGKDDPRAILTVKDLYEEMNLPKVHDEYEAGQLHFVRKQIEKNFEKYPDKLFLKLLSDIADEDNWKATEWWCF